MLWWLLSSIFINSWAKSQVDLSPLFFQKPALNVLQLCLFAQRKINQCTKISAWKFWRFPGFTFFFFLILEKVLQKKQPQSSLTTLGKNCQFEVNEKIVLVIKIKHSVVHLLFYNITLHIFLKLENKLGLLSFLIYNNIR